MLHKLYNQPIEELDLREVFANDKAYILYTDPPWNEGNLRYWSTINKRQTGKVIQPISFDRMLDIIYKIITDYVDGYVFIEQSKFKIEEVTKKFKPLLHNF
jgi:hypothetical protein